MCGRFEVLSRDAVADVVRVLEAVSPANVMPDWPARLVCPDGETANAIPGDAADVVVVDARGALSIARLTWGFTVDWSSRPVYNTRLEKAMGPEPGMWAEPIARGRCLVPTCGFFETHGSEKVRSLKTGRQIKRRYRFGDADGAPLLLAAVCGDGCFSIVTTSPNAVVSPVHDRMPLVLNPQEAAWWLCASWPEFASGWQKLADCGEVRLTSRPEQAAVVTSTPYEQGTLF